MRSSTVPSSAITSPALNVSGANQPGEYLDLLLRQSGAERETRRTASWTEESSFHRCASEVSTRFR